MIVKTRGIVLKSISYTETSLIVQIFTEELGMQSYLIRGARKSKAKIPQSLFQPLQLLDLIVHHRPNAGIQRLTEAKQALHLTQIPFQMSKRAVVLFLNEILYNALPKHEKDPLLFDFLFHALQWLDMCNASQTATFHLQFLGNLCKYLGFGILSNDEKNFSYFDLRQGVFTHIQPLHNDYVNKPHSKYLDELFSKSLTEKIDTTLSRSEKHDLLHHLVRFYELHITGFKHINTLDILSEVFE